MVVLGSAYELAQYLIDVDKTIPSLQTACILAYEEGTNEQRIRDSRFETARAFLMDFFKGEIPSSIVDYEIADSTPGAADLIRLTIHDPDTPFWRTRSFDFPFVSRNLLTLDYVQTFIDDTNLQYGVLQLNEDNDNRNQYPTAHYRPFESEAEGLGLLSDEI